MTCTLFSRGYMPRTEGVIVDVNILSQHLHFIVANDITANMNNPVTYLLFTLTTPQTVVAISSRLIVNPNR